MVNNKKILITGKAHMEGSEQKKKVSTGTLLLLVLLGSLYPHDYLEIRKIDLSMLGSKFLRTSKRQK